MIEKLTKEQEKDLIVFREKWFKIGLSTEQANHEIAEKIISSFYEKINKNKPKFFWCDSPLEAQIFICILKNMEKKDAKTFRSLNFDNVKIKKFLYEISKNYEKEINYVTNYFFGQLDSFWIAFYLFCEKIGVKYVEDKSKLLHEWEELAKNCNLWYPYENICFLCEKPIELHVNNNNVLHADEKPSMKFKDGFSLYNLNGVRVPKEIVMTPANKLDSNLIITENNAQVRSEIVKKISIAKVCADLNAKIIEKGVDAKGKYCELISLDTGDGEYRPYIRLENASINGLFHVEPVSKKCTTLKQAFEYRNGISYHPKKIT